MIFSERSIAYLAVVGIAAYLVLLLFPILPKDIPIFIVLAFGGVPLVFDLAKKAFSGEFGADLLAGISIVVSVILGEYLAGALVVLMLSGGEAVESYAMAKASHVLDALARRMPSIAHIKTANGLTQISANEIKPGDHLVVLPHELCPVDGTVIEGKSSMDESYLTGEPYQISKTPGCSVISGAVNGEQAITIRADKPASDSRYLKIMAVMDSSKQKRPRMRRLGDTLGALYTPVALAIAGFAWWWSGDAVRFLSVLVVATPCPLLIAIPIAIIGAVSLCARRSIIVRDPVVLEQAHRCNVLIFDKTGTLTYGEPDLTEISVAPRYTTDEVLQLAASIEQYSKHPLAKPILKAAKQRGLMLEDVTEVGEQAGQGMTGTVRDKEIKILGRKQVPEEMRKLLPEQSDGLECIVLVDGKYAGTCKFRDEPRRDSFVFVNHLGASHGVSDVILLSGDRESEVSYLAKKVGIKHVYFGKSPEEKVEIVREATKSNRTLFLGDGINDAPALLSATVGVAFGPKSDIAAEAAGAVILDPALKRVDEFIHISNHLYSVALQSAVGGMALSVIGMAFAAAGLLTPVVGAILQEVIDLAVVFNALRTAWPPAHASDL